MKTAILLANIGNSDLGIGEDSIFSPKNSSFTGNVYEESKKRWELGDYKDLDLPILEPTIKKIKESFDLQEIILFGTEQPTYNKQDTIYVALIAKNIICERYNFDEEKVKISTISENPTYYEGLMKFYQQEVRSIQDSTADQIFVSTTGGTPQINISLMLQIFYKFGEVVKIIYKPRDENEAIISDIIFQEKKEIVRVGTVQIDFSLVKDKFPPEIENKEATKNKIMRALEIASHEGVNIVCLPELCMCAEWVPEIEKLYKDMIIIAGSYYDKKNRNVSFVINSNDKPQVKMTPSISEKSFCTHRMECGKKINIYETKFGKFSVLICRDFINHVNRSEEKVDMIFVPSYNPPSGVDSFHEAANIYIKTTPSYVIISNVAKFGGTSVFGILNWDLFPSLREAGHKDEDDNTYKLCRVKSEQEEIIIADLNLVHKSAQIPTPGNPDHEIHPVYIINRIKIE